jgi:hypothetical protein
MDRVSRGDWLNTCHRALRRAHTCSHIALLQAFLRECCNQFTGQLKLRRFRSIGLTNGGIGQQLGCQVFHVDSSRCFNLMWAISIR